MTPLRALPTCLMVCSFTALMVRSLVARTSCKLRVSCEGFLADSAALHTAPV
jgi:hypothetical protein